MKRYEFSIGISGTHGKTTTTSMITQIMLEAGKDPTVHIGGELDAIGGSVRIGGQKYFITEADEYYGSFLKFSPTMAVILNVELDHVDYYKDIEHVKETFIKFASLVPETGYVIACVDDANINSILDRMHGRIITYGIKNHGGMWSAKDISFDEQGHPSYTLVKDGTPFSKIELNVPGMHNVNNSLAAIAACTIVGCEMEMISNSLKRFGGAHRRLELKGVINGIKVIDDYAHHPTEVKASLKAANNCEHNKLWCVFQPHTYTRAKAFLGEFADALTDADSVIVTDIYAAREADKGEVHASMLAEELRSKNQDVMYIHGFESIVDFLKANAKAGDLVITMGAGDVFKVGEMLLSKKL